MDVIAHLEAGIDFAEDDVEIPDADAMAEAIELRPIGSAGSSCRRHIRLWQSCLATGLRTRDRRQTECR